MEPCLKFARDSVLVINLQTFVAAISFRPRPNQICCNAFSFKQAGQATKKNTPNLAPISLSKKTKDKKEKKKIVCHKSTTAVTKQENAQETGKREPTEEKNGERGGGQALADFSGTPCRSNK